ncbi:MAG: hypothetical protein Q8R58_03160 [Sulfuricurvum sp.]|nr:hypothetical protein [Sulfuricurvum sp.]
MKIIYGILFFIAIEIFFELPAILMYEKNVYGLTELIIINLIMTILIYRIVYFYMMNYKNEKKKKDLDQYIQESLKNYKGAN